MKSEKESLNSDIFLELKNKKVALVHDFLTQYGGAEKVLESLCEMFPKAPIYTLIYDRERMKGKFFGRKIRTSFLNNFPEFLKRRSRWLLPFMTVAPETFDLRDFDLVISSSGAWSKGIVTRLNTNHIAYIHSPMRFAWDYNEKYLRDIKTKAGFLGRCALNYVRLWDYQASKRPDILIANSQYTQRRIKKYYNRESEIIYPPSFSAAMNGADLTNEKIKGKYFLVVSRLSSYKKVDLVVEAFNKIGLPLVVIGEGEQEKYLKKIAGKNVAILGWQNEEKVRVFLANARAFIFPAIDDFGIAAVEAMSFGVPVIGIRRGGIKEIIKEGVNGEFFNAQTAEVLVDGVRRFVENENKYNNETIRESVRDFEKDMFSINIIRVLEKLLKKD